LSIFLQIGTEAHIIFLPTSPAHEAARKWNSTSSTKMKDEHAVTHFTVLIAPVVSGSW